MARSQLGRCTRRTRKVAFADGSSTELTIVPTGDPSAPVVLCLPAMGVRSGYYELLADALADQGFTAVLADLRGSGSSSVRAGRRVRGWWAWGIVAAVFLTVGVLRWPMIPVVLAAVPASILLAWRGERLGTRREERPGTSGEARGG